MENLILDVSRITEVAALATFSEIGKGNKIKADDKAVKGMEFVLKGMNVDAEVVIGEGEIDDAPMLYIGQKLGLGGKPCDIAVDPIDGTRMVALGQDSAIAVIVLAKKDSLLKAPDMYMQKLIVSAKGKGSINLNDDLETNIINLAKHLNKKPSELTIMTLAKPRHEEDIKTIQKIGAKVIAIPDGDVEGSLSVAIPETEVDMFYAIGGAPEGVISAAMVRCLDGDMQARLLTRVQAKGNVDDNEKFAQIETDKCKQLGIDLEKVYNLNDLASSDEVVVSMTGITQGKLLQATKINGDYAHTDTVVISGQKRTIREIKSTHVISKMEPELKQLIKGE